MNNEAESQGTTAIFGGGCFWCLQQPFAERDGVSRVVAGYCGGTVKDPNYQMVASGRTDHYECVRVEYDPDLVDYADLVGIFWRQIDPTDQGGQFADRGDHYRTAIFYLDEEQRRVAERSKRELEEAGIFTEPVATKILPATSFYDAEEYHQDYYKKNSAHYAAYKRGSGRQSFLDNVWSRVDFSTTTASSSAKPAKEELRERLSPLQYQVTQEDGTEPPFANKYWDHKARGIYVDIVSGEALFSSEDKFDSGTGWPSFTRPLVEDNIVEKTDRKLFSVRTEVRSREGDSHLGHVFPDGPEPTGMRYCINSAALRFIPAEELQERGYGEYLEVFEN